MYVFGSGRCGWRGGEWMRKLGLDFTNPVVTGGVFDMCLCFDCGDVWPACPKTVIGPPLLGREGSTQFAKQLESAVTVPPLVGCVVWSPKILFTIILGRSFTTCPGQNNLSI